jgi:hypothetical protein
MSTFPVSCPSGQGDYFSHVCSSAVCKSLNLAYERWIKGENLWSTEVWVLWRLNVWNLRTACIYLLMGRFFLIGNSLFQFPAATPLTFSCTLQQIYVVQSVVENVWCEDCSSFLFCWEHSLLRPEFGCVRAICSTAKLRCYTTGLWCLRRIWCSSLFQIWSAQYHGFDVWW